MSSPLGLANVDRKSTPPQDDFDLRQQQLLNNSKKRGKKRSFDIDSLMVSDSGNCQNIQITSQQRCYETNLVDHCNQSSLIIKSPCHQSLAKTPIEGNLLGESQSIAHTTSTTTTSYMQGDEGKLAPAQQQDYGNQLINDSNNTLEQQQQQTFATNLTTSTNNTSKYNVLQVLQPTSILSPYDSTYQQPVCQATSQIAPPTDQTCSTTTQQPVHDSKANQQNVTNCEAPNINNSSRLVITDTPSQNKQEIASNSSAASHSIGASRQQDDGQQLTSSLTFMPSLAVLATYPMFNWCAKCSASFRMTSDLVHHMRTHHKRHRTN